MTTLTIGSPPTPAPHWLRGAATLGVAWNLYGVYQFAAGLTPAGRAAATAGMTAAQADLYLSLPAWIGVAFAIGVLGGLAGSIGLLVQRTVARPLLATSLVGYCLLFAGDLQHGVFEALPGQLAILAVVLFVAAALLLVSWHAGRRGLLR